LSHGWRLALLGVLPLAILILALILLHGILLPFVVGMAAAYLLDPAADWLQRLHFSRTAATTSITLSFFLFLVVAVVLVLPALASQAAELANELPRNLEQLRGRLTPWLADLATDLGLDENWSAQGLIERFSERIIGFVGTALSQVLQSGVALLNLLSLIFVTPVVTFYLLRDWDRMVARVNAVVPRDLLPTVERLAHEVDQVLGGVIRGQGMVCLFLAIFYATGLWFTGLRYGVVIGLLTGLFSFIPYIGMALGLCVGLVVAVFQFQDWVMVAVVVAVFAAGQFIEGNFVTPRLVGSRIGVHPVWLIFAVLAGAALFGIVGALLAVPAAAVIGVFLRFGLERYRTSELYNGPAAAGSGRSDAAR
jgi:predicted PurR-regulated permease PerM